jgi:hypothetical protein
MIYNSWKGYSLIRGTVLHEKKRSFLFLPEEEE